MMLKVADGYRYGWWLFWSCALLFLNGCADPQPWRYDSEIAMYPAVIYDVRPDEPKSSSVIPAEVGLRATILDDLATAEGLQRELNPFWQTNSHATIPEAVKVRANEAREAICPEMIFNEASKSFLTNVYLRRYALQCERVAVYDSQGGCEGASLPEDPESDLAAIQGKDLKKIVSAIQTGIHNIAIVERQLSRSNWNGYVEELKQERDRQWHVVYVYHGADRLTATNNDSNSSTTHFLGALKTYQVVASNRCQALQAEYKVYNDWQPHHDE